MKGERPLFPNNQLVSDETHKKWRERVDYLLEEDHASRLNDWEAGFVQDMEQRLANGRDLSLAQSYRLNEIFHRIEEAVG